LPKSLNMFSLNFKIALRSLVKNKWISLINIGGLAIGLACCLLLLLYIGYEWSFNTKFKNLDRIYISMINSKTNGTLRTLAYAPAKLAPAVKESISGVEYASRINWHPGTQFSNQSSNFRLNAISVDPDFLKILQYPCLSGNISTALNTPDGVVLTKNTAQKLFGNSNPVGKSIKWNNIRILTVTAVISNIEKNETFQFDAIQSWAFDESVNEQIKTLEWGAISCQTIYKLRDKNSYKQTDKSLRNLIKLNDPETNNEAFLFPFKEYHLYSEFANGKPVGGKIDRLKLFFLLACCVLLIASINYMNLSTARSEKRAREVGVRKALGSNRKSLMMQFFIESLLFSTIATVIALVFLELSLSHFNYLLDTNTEIHYGSYQIWVILATLLLITTLTAGSYPALYLSSFSPNKVLKGFKGAGSLSVRKILVVIQFSLSVCMIICAITIHSQIQYVSNKPLGFDENNLLQIRRDGNFKDFTRLKLFKEQLKNSGSVSSISEIGGSLTNNSNSSGDFVWPGRDMSKDISIQFRSIGFDYVKTIGAKILKGRDFSANFPADTSTSLILNEAAVKIMGLKNPVGSLINWGDDESLKIVGVIKDYANDGADSKVLPTVFYNNPRRTEVMLLRLNPALPLNESVNTIKALWQHLNPEFPIEIEFTDKHMAEKLHDEKITSVLADLFGGFCIFISCLGLLGLAIYVAEQRQKEISIRKVLGADLNSILILLNKDFIKLVLISNIFAFPIAYILSNKWLRQYDYSIEIGFAPFIFAFFISVFIALFCVSLQTFKIAKANPVDALKYE